MGTARTLSLTPGALEEGDSNPTSPSQDIKLTMATKKPNVLKGFHWESLGATHCHATVRATVPAVSPYSDNLDANLDFKSCQKLKQMSP